MIVQAIFYALVLGLIGVIAAYVKRFFKFSGYLESLGVPIEDYNLGRLYKTKIIDLDVANLRKNLSTKIWGSYVGITPHVFIADPEILKDVMVKNFANFTDRMDYGLPEKEVNILDARGNQWKTVRQALTPTFTASKIRAMTEPINRVSKGMVEAMDKEVKKAKDGCIDMKPIFQGLSLDSISNCAFGIDTNSFTNPENKLLTTCINTFTDMRFNSKVDNFFWELMSYVPWIAGILPLYDTKAYEYFDAITKDVAAARRKAGHSFSNSPASNFVDRLNDLVNKKSLPSERETWIQGRAFFQAGFETTSNTMSTLSYNLATCKDGQAIQDAILGEVEQALAEGKDLHEADLPYTEATLLENLRMSSPVTRIDRTCTADTRLSNGLLIKKGTVIVIPIYAIHHCDDYFTESDQFRPERFLDDNDGGAPPLAYLPFGGGPRICIGMRFAITELKIATAKLIQKYRLRSCSDTKLDVYPGDLFLLSYPEVKVQLEER